MLVTPTGHARATAAAPPESPGGHGRFRRRRSLETARARTVDFTAVAPAPERRAPLWHIPVPHESTPPPMVWLLGAHGGAGVSTLAQVLGPAADCERRWPAVLATATESESPFVVIVAKESIEGLTRAHDLLRQWHSGAGMGRRRSHLLGLITVAHSPGRVPKPIRRYLEVVDAASPARWRVDWQDAWPATRIADLPIWTPRSPEPAKGTDPHAAVRELGEGLITAVRTAVYGPENDENPAQEGHQK